MRHMQPSDSRVTHLRDGIKPKSLIKILRLGNGISSFLIGITHTGSQRTTLPFVLYGCRVMYRNIQNFSPCFRGCVQKHWKTQQRL